MLWSIFSTLTQSFQVSWDFLRMICYFYDFCLSTFFFSWKLVAIFVPNLKGWTLQNLMSRLKRPINLQSLRPQPLNLFQVLERIGSKAVDHLHLRNWSKLQWKVQIIQVRNLFIKWCFLKLFLPVHDVWPIF